jgi:hypothetical protein
MCITIFDGGGSNWLITGSQIALTFLNDFHPVAMNDSVNSRFSVTSVSHNSPSVFDLCNYWDMVYDLILIAKIQLYGQRPSHAMSGSGFSYVFSRAG